MTPAENASLSPGGPARWSGLCRLLQTASFVLWWGGLTFYAAVVVPVGGRVVGAADQGLVTQQVTHWLNALGLVTLVVLFPRPRTAPVLAWRIGWWAALLAQGALLALHIQLDRLLAAAPYDAETFYAWHRVYLWLTTLQWLAGGALGVLFFRTPPGG